MSSTTVLEKADVPGSGPQTTTTAVHEKVSSGSLRSLEAHIGSVEAAPAAPRTSDLSASSTQHNPFDTDVEAMVMTRSSDPSQKSSTLTKCPRGGEDCQVWPGQDHWQRKAKAAKMKTRNCNCLARLSKRNRIIAKVVIGLLIIGIAVGVGFGVSKPLHAAIWHTNGNSN